MKNVTRSQVKQFIDDPLSYAMLMEDHEIEATIAKLMAVLYRRKKTSGGE